MKNIEIKLNPKASKKFADHFEKRKLKQERGIAYFKTLVEGVDYKKEKTDMDAPLEVFKLVPISEKGAKYFKGEY